MWRQALPLANLGALQLAQLNVATFSLVAMALRALCAHARSMGSMWLGGRVAQRGRYGTRLGSQSSWGSAIVVLEWFPIVAADDIHR